jgi:large subunit ribosomal protein L19e
MNLTTQRRIAADILKCGYYRVWIDPEFIEDVQMAISREDIKELINEGKIKKRPEKGISRFNAKINHERKKRGLARGIGKRKGTKHSIVPSKTEWINRIRIIRVKLKELRNKGEINPHNYRILYLRAKGGMFQNVKNLLRYIDENKMRN